MEKKGRHTHTHTQIHTYTLEIMSQQAMNKDILSLKDSFLLKYVLSCFQNKKQRIWIADFTLRDHSFGIPGILA